MTWCTSHLSKGDNKSLYDFFGLFYSFTTVKLERRQMIGRQFIAAHCLMYSLNLMTGRVASETEGNSLGQGCSNHARKPWEVLQENVTLVSVAISGTHFLNQW